MPKTSREWTQEELVTAITDFHEAMLYIDHNRQVWQDTIKECENAFCDIRHFCELDYPKERSKRTEVCRKLQYYGQRRRKYKDLLTVTEPLAEKIAALNNIGIYRMANKVKKIHESTLEGHRTYVPRIERNLWEKKDE